MSLVLNVPEQGQLVDVRQRRYVVVDVAQSALPPDLLKSGSYRRNSIFIPNSNESSARCYFQES